MARIPSVRKSARGSSDRRTGVQSLPRLAFYWGAEVSEGDNKWGFEVAAAYAAMGRRDIGPLGGRWMKPHWDDDGNKVGPGKAGKGRLEVYPFVLPQRDGGDDNLAKLLGHPKDMRRVREAVAHVWAVWEAALVVRETPGEAGGAKCGEVGWSDARRAMKLVHAFAAGLAVVAEAYGPLIVEEGRWAPDGDVHDDATRGPDGVAAWDAPEGTEWNLVRSLPGDIYAGFDLGGVHITLKQALRDLAGGTDLAGTLDKAAKLLNRTASGLGDDAEVFGDGSPVWTLVRRAVLAGSRPSGQGGRFAAAAANRASCVLDDTGAELMVDLVLGANNASEAGLPTAGRATFTDLVWMAGADGSVTFEPAEIPLDDTISRMADSRLASSEADLGHVMALAGFVFGNLERIRSDGWEEAYGRLLGLSSKAAGGEWTEVPGWAWTPDKGFDSEVVASVADRAETAARAALDTIGKSTGEDGYLERMDEIRESAGRLLGAVAASAPAGDPLAWLDEPGADVEAVWKAVPGFVRTEIAALAAERGPVPGDAAGMIRRLAEMRSHDEKGWKGETAREGVRRIVESLGRSGPLDDIPEELYDRQVKAAADQRDKAKNHPRTMFRAVRDLGKKLTVEDASAFLNLLTGAERACLGLEGLPPFEAVQSLAEACELKRPASGNSVGRKAVIPSAEVWLLWGCVEVCSMFGVPIPNPSAPTPTPQTAPHRVLADWIWLAAGRGEGSQDEGDGPDKNGKRVEHVALVKAALDELGMPSALSGIRWSP